MDCDLDSIPDDCEIDANSGAPGGPYFCQASCETDCGYENLVTWLSSTKYGTAEPIMGNGPSFTVQYDDTLGLLDEGGMWQWLGARADNAVFSQDQKLKCFSEPVATLSSSAEIDIDVVDLHAAFSTDVAQYGLIAFDQDQIEVTTVSDSLKRASCIAISPQSDPALLAGMVLMKRDHLFARDPAVGTVTVATIEVTAEVQQNELTLRQTICFEDGITALADETTIVGGLVIERVDVVTVSDFPALVQAAAAGQLQLGPGLVNSYFGATTVGNSFGQITFADDSMDLSQAVGELFGGASGVGEGGGLLEACFCVASCFQAFEIDVAPEEAICVIVGASACSVQCSGGFTPECSACIGAATQCLSPVQSEALSLCVFDCLFSFPEGDF